MKSLLLALAGVQLALAGSLADPIPAVPTIPTNMFPVTRYGAVGGV